MITNDKSRFQIVCQILEGEGHRAFDNAAASSILCIQDAASEKMVVEEEEEKAEESTVTLEAKIPKKKKKKKQASTVMGDAKEGPFENAIKSMFRHFFLADALMNQKWFMRHDIHKPRQMSIRQVYERLE